MEHGYFKWRVPIEKLPIKEVSLPNLLTYDESFASYLTDTQHLNSGACGEVFKSPRHYAYSLLNKIELEEEPGYFRFGRAVHAAVLEPKRFRELYVVAPEFSGPTKEGKMSTRSAAAQKEKEKWYADVDPEAIILKADEMDMLCEMLDCILEHKIVGNFFKNGKAEVTGRFTHPEFGFRCKIRPDYLTIMPDGRYYFFDLKTTRSAEPGLFDKESARLVYDLKMAFYWDGLTTIFGREPEACGLIPIQKSMPSKTDICWTSELELDEGRRKYKHAIVALEKSIKTGIWPREKSFGRMLQRPQYMQDQPLPEYDWGDDEQGPKAAEDTDQHLLQRSGRADSPLPIRGEGNESHPDDGLDGRRHDPTDPGSQSGNEA